MLEQLIKEIEKNANNENAKGMQRFFKTAKGEYAEGDIFLGISSPVLQKLTKQYPLNLAEIQELIKSKEHEKRSVSLWSLINLYKKSKNKKEIVDFYLANTKYINNWDLVDISCYKILGDFLLNYCNENYDILLKLSKSENMWERRIAIVSTMMFVKNNSLQPTFKIAKILLKNEHDLINKAVGWLLREAGKKDKEKLKNFLMKNIDNVSNITLSYAMEKFTNEEKKETKKHHNK
ncbi:MAG: DNA alkylation repair protein [Rickettsiales bacterium]|nr:DNA alkylation repair protein [Rickettsiales bacterium]